MTSGSVWVTGDVITAIRMNQKTVLVDTGANLNSATLAAGMLMYCTATGSGYTIDHLYEVKSDGSTVVDITASLGVVLTSQVADVYDTTIGDYTQPTSATSSSNGTVPSYFTGSSSYVVDLSGSSAFDNIFLGYSGQHLRIGRKQLATDFGAGYGCDFVKIPLIRTGSAGGTLIARIRKQSDDSIIVASTTTFAASSISTSLTVYQFNFPVNTITVDCRISVEIDSSTCSAGNTIGVGYSTETGTLTLYAYPSGGYTDQTTNNARFSVSKRLTSTTSSPTFVYDGDTTTEWVSNSETHPNIYVDMGATAILTGAAIYWDGTSTTSTQILVQTSPDGSTWTTVRTINTNLLTNGAWNYFRWNLPTTVLNRYVRFYANDAGSVVLAIWEIKIKQYANTTSGLQNLFVLHGHPLISSSVATTPLAA